MNAYSEYVLKEADDIVAEFGMVRDADDLDSLADELLKNLEAFYKGPEFGRRVAAELRRRAEDFRNSDLRKSQANVEG